MLEQFKKNKSLTFLVSLLLMILVFPFFEMSRVGSLVFTLLFTGALLAGVYAISYDARYIAIGTLLVSPILVCHWSNLILSNPQIELVQRVCSAVFMIYTLIALLKRVLQAPKAGANEIFGAISAYVLIGMVFGFFYLFIEMISPDAFKLNGSPKDVATFVYFSFVTLSTVGYGDVSAVLPFARALAVIEMIIGVTYIGVLVGKLVSSSQMDEAEEKNAEIHERNEEREILRDFLGSPQALKGKVIWLVAACVMTNFVASVLMFHLQLPFFLDSWGTSLAVIMGGWWAGAVVAVLYHLLIAATFWGWESWIWVYSSLSIAGLTWYFSRNGWLLIHRPFKLIAAGVIAGTLNAVLAHLIMIFSHLPPYHGTLAVYSFFLKVTGNSMMGSMIEKVFVEIADKTISLMIAAGVVFLLHDLIEHSKKGHEKHEKA